MRFSIQTPDGRNLLINGGESTSKLSDELGRRLPYFSRKLDWLIIASTQEEQLAALPRVVERYPPENVLWSGNVQASFPAQALDKYFAEQMIPVSKAEVGQRLELGDQAWVEVKAVGPRGSVLLIEYKNFRALLPIGLSEGTLDELEFGNVIDKVDVLLLADAGYAPSNPPDLIENVNPQLTVLSVAAGDPNGLPSQDVLGFARRLFPPADRSQRLDSSHHRRRKNARRSGAWTVKMGTEYSFLMLW